MTKEQTQSFEQASKPLVKWLNENCNPHSKVIVVTNGAELVSGEHIAKIEEFIKD